MKMRSGKAGLTVSLDVFFADNQSVNDKLRRLVAQFSLTPFCYVENEHLRNSILGKDDSGQNMALALQNLTVTTVPGQPGLLNARFNFTWFNYKPYVKNFHFKNLPFISLPHKQPGAAFQMFYLPQLSKHSKMTFNDSKLRLSQFEFLITGDEKFAEENNISLDVNKQAFDSFRNLLDDFVRTTDAVRANTEETDTADLSGFNLDGLSDIVFRLGSGDPTVTNAGGISRALAEASSAATILENAQVTTTGENKDINKLIAQNKQLLDVSSQIFRNKDVWFEFPADLLGGSNSIGKDKPSKLYFRRVDLEFGTENDGLIIEQIAASHSNMLAMLPMTGHQYPTAQYLGSSDKRFSLNLKVLDDVSLQEYVTFLNIHNNNVQLGKFIPQSYTNIEVKNELFEFMSINEVLIENSVENTVPDHPGLYSVSLDVVERGVRPEDEEAFRAVPTSFGQVRIAIWDAIWRNIAVHERANLIPTGKGAQEPGAKEFLEDTISGFLRPEIESMLNFASGTTIGRGFNIGIPVYNQITANSAGANAQQGAVEFGQGLPVANVSRDQLAKRKDSPNKISKGFRNLLVLTSLSDEDVLAVEGLSNVMWNWGGAGSGALGNASLSARLLDPVDTESAIFTSGLSEARKVIRAKLEQNIETTEDRYKKIQAAADGIREYKAAIAQGGQSAEGASTLRVQNAQGEFVNLDKVLKEAGLEDDFRNKVIAAGEEDWLGGFKDLSATPIIARHPLGRLLSYLATQSVGDEQQDFVDEYIEDLDNELRDLEEALDSGERVGDLTDIFRRGTGPFSLWIPRARDLADLVMQTDIIEFDMFAEAKKLLDEMETSHHGHIYKDMPMQEVQNVVQDSLGQGYPQGLRLEPDFYFINETADLSLNSFVPEEQVVQIRDYSSQYIDDVIDHNKNWFQETYLKEVGSSFGKFLEDSSDKQNVSSRLTDLFNSPGLSQMNKPPKSTGSVNNATVTRVNSGKTKELRGQKSLNTIPVSAGVPESQNSMSKFADAKNYVVHVPNTIISANAKESLSSDAWIMPIEGNVFISSTPGERNVKNGSKYHKGTDIVLRPKGTVNGKPVFAAAEGEVIAKRTWGGTGFGTGNQVVIKTVSGGEIYHHKYYHLAAFTDDYAKGDIVKKGQLIGFVGNTGTKAPHLHFEVRRGASSGDIIWPFGSWLPRGPIKSRENDPIYDVSLISWGDTSHEITNVAGIAPTDRGNTILEESMKSMSRSWNKNAGYRMNRAYPGIYLAFIEEDSPREVLVFDAFFNYQSIVSCDIVRDREVAADYCKLVLTNISGVLSNKHFQGTLYENEALKRGELSTKNTNSNVRGTVKETQITSLMLREGIKVEVRLGYSDSPDNLTDVIVGRIVGVQWDETGDIVQVEIQSLATELVQDIKGLDKSVSFNSFLFNDANTGPLLENLIASPECVSFGLWERGNKINNENRGILSNRFQWNPRPQSDNIFAPSGEAMNAIDPGFVFDRITYRMYQSTIWDVFKEMELRHPEYIASPVPYSESNGSKKRMTMFFGLPDQLYHSRDPSLTENRRSATVKQNREEQKKSLLSTFRTGGKVLGAAQELLSNSAVTLDNRQELLSRLKQSFSNPSHTNILTGGSSEQEFKVEGRVSALVDAFIDAELAKDAIESGAIQPFRKYHLLTSDMHIVANNLKAKASNTFNAVTVQYEDISIFDKAANYATAGLANQISELVRDDLSIEIDDPETITMKLDPAIPDEFIRENFVIFPNCLGEAMAKNYCVSLLQKGVWQTYGGELIILGNPDIKPYDICYVNDAYTDMVGPFQVRRVSHHFSHETGFITVLTPDCVAYASEGTGLTQNQAMALMAEVFLRKTAGIDHKIITPGRTPLDGAQTTPGSYQLAAAAGNLINFFGGKRMLFRTQFDDPIHVVPMFKQGKPLVAGFGPIHLRKNFFSTKGFLREAKDAMTGLMEGVDSLTLQWDKGLLHETRGRLNGENVRQFKIRSDQ